MARELLVLTVPPPLALPHVLELVRYCQTPCAIRIAIGGSEEAQAIIATDDLFRLLNSEAYGQSDAFVQFMSYQHGCWVRENAVLELTPYSVSLLGWHDGLMCQILGDNVQFADGVLIRRH